MIYSIMGIYDLFNYGDLGDLGPIIMMNTTFYLITKNKGMIKKTQILIITQVRETQGHLYSIYFMTSLSHIGSSILHPGYMFYGSFLWLVY